jgi:hypothetical protein
MNSGRHKKRAVLTQDRLRELLDYDPDTGRFVWKVTSSNRAVAGSVAGNTSSYGYRRINVLGEAYLAHRLAFLWMTGEMPSNQVDHINGQRSDNRWANLRPATNAENGRNIRGNSRNTSGVTGVTRDRRRGVWQAQIKTGGKNITIGRYTDFDEAASARKRAEKELFGEFAPQVSL